MVTMILLAAAVAVQDGSVHLVRGGAARAPVVRDAKTQLWSPETVVACALKLLGRSERSFPPVWFAERLPPEVSPTAQGYVLFEVPRIVLVTSTAAFRQARRALDRCGELRALREIAGVLAHEEWHLRHGPDERGAYDAQLTALLTVGEIQSGRLYYKVLRAKQAVTSASKRHAR